MVTRTVIVIRSSMAMMGTSSMTMMGSSRWMRLAAGWPQQERREEGFTGLPEVKVSSSSSSRRRTMSRRSSSILMCKEEVVTMAGWVCCWVLV